MAGQPSSSNGAKPGKGPVQLLIGTMKGAFTLSSNATRTKWKLGEPWFFGAEVNHIVRDPRNPKVLMAGVKTGHLGPTVYRSLDGGKNWQESKKPPKFPKAAKGKDGLSVETVFFVAPDHPDCPNCWYAGTVPWGLFHSEDNGESWKPVKGFNNHPDYEQWGFPSPAGKITHSIIVDPRDPNRLYVSCSVAGFFESTNRGKKWQPVNKGLMADYSPDKYPVYGHDPHLTVMCPSNPDRFWQQNHCGIYRMDRPEGEWHRVGRKMPKKVGDIGFPIVAHPRDENRAWVFPMDGTDIWPRTSPSGQPATYHTKDGGKTWKRQNKGLPPKNGWFTVLRQSMVSDHHDPVGLYFGTTGGEIWASRDEGESWSCAVQHLPRILSVKVAH